jgi:FtsP/CotA-like multicopper oxidase with cupredoxin domain
MAMATNLTEPITLASKNGLLDILIVARPEPLPTMAPLVSTGWVYDVCPRPTDGSSACPTGSTAPNVYGGTRLKLQQGDMLKIRLVNQLPLALNAKHQNDPGEAFLRLNPTNIHTHGMLVSPHYATASDPTYGDNVFVLTFNSANGQAQPSPHIHSVIRYDYTDYTIQIPANHPSGLFWFHPHAHGVALNQISAGMAGIITVGDVQDYVCAAPGCPGVPSAPDVRHIILKDTQILGDTSMHDQEDPAFCATANPPSPGTSLGQGSCPGQDQTANGGGNYTGGRWFFTLNGLQYPTIPVTAGQGEIWRITNASGSATYDLQLWDPAQSRNILMQVLAIDGVSVSPTATMSMKDIATLTAAKMQPEACPGLTPGAGSPGDAEPLCVRRLHMMPSSRVEVWVAYRDQNDFLVAPPAGASAIFRTAGFNTGPGGDSWPPVDLGNVQFNGPGPGAGAANLLKVQGQGTAMSNPLPLAANMSAANAAVPADPTCKPLPPGHMRRIFFAVPASNPNGFGLGYEEVDEKGVPVPNTFMDITPFDPMKPTVCVPLAAGNSPAIERWQLINLANEDHNFHIHQTKFRILTTAELDGTLVPGTVLGQGVMLDNVPLEHSYTADGNGCNDVATWRAGNCTAYPSTVEIPFAIAGDFVYHCHILEHEDGGMMARIRVRPN